MSSFLGGGGGGGSGGGGRTLLTGNATYYVATTGSDSNPGTLAQPWATLQHAAFFIGSNLDIAGFTIIVNIGSGSFVGFGVPSFVGGGILQFIGAGRTLTSITAGPNDGVFNFGECFDVEFDSSTITSVDKVTFVPNPFAVAVYAPGVATGLGSFITFTGDVGINLAAVSNQPCVFVGANGSVLTVQGTTTCTGGGGSGTLFHAVSGGQISINNNVTISGAFTTANGGLIICQALSDIIFAFGATITGAGVTGGRFVVDQAAIINTGSGNINFIPGNSPGTITNGGIYL